MFEYDDLDAMPRVLMLKKQKETKDYWKQLMLLKGACIAWQAQSIELVRLYKAAGGVSDLTKAVDNAAIKGEITLKKLENQISRTNEYLKDIDIRLSDGTRWYSAIEIQQFADSLDESRSPDVQ